MKNKKTLVLAVIMASAVASQAAVVSVGGWTVNDNSFADDAAGTFSTSGTWGSANTEPNDWGNNFLYDSISGSDSATWTFLGLTPGTYAVAVSWAEKSNRTPVAPFDVQGSSAGTVNMETVAIGGPLLSDGSNDIPFQILTSTAVVAIDGILTVKLNGLGGGGNTNYVIADAVAIQAVPEPSSTALLGLGGLALILRRRK